MKTLLTFLFVISLIAMFSSCQTASNLKKFLSDKENRREIMANIANDSVMMDEMNETVINSQNGKNTLLKNEKITMMIMENNGTMLKIMKNNPTLMNRMLSDMMETAKSDTNMIYGMYNTVMKNQGMMDMIQRHRGNNMEGENANMNMMNGTDNKKGNMNNMDGMNNKTGKK